MKKQKIAILGAGPSGLTAAYWLTSTPELRERYEITFYQMGWRVGGKGRSGRSGPNARIEEHGLHILFGFYQNFFTMIRKVYDELGRPPQHPLATWREAFQPHDMGVVEQERQRKWYPMWIEFPANRAIPGAGGDALNSSRDYLVMMLQGALEVVFGPRVMSWFEEYAFPRGERWVTASDIPPPDTGHRDLGVDLALMAMKECLRIAGTALSILDALPLLERILQRLRKTAIKRILKSVNKDLEAFRFWTGVDFFVALSLGIIRDRVFELGGLDKIDQYDFREWLARHGIQPVTQQTPYVRTVYDAAFSYVNGETNEQNCAAGSALRSLIRGQLTYKATSHFRMMSGMGDTVFGPLYQVLEKRGVQFKLFRKVEEVKVEGDKVSSVRVTVQAKTKDGKPYNPFLNVKGLECWPSEPLYDQLKDADRLKKVDLESYYTDWHPYPEDDEILRAGEEFDQVMLATPIACIPFIAPDILKENQRWRDMVDNVKTVPTVALQLWFNKTLPEMGWNKPPPLLSLYVEPMNTWADMSQVLPTENWPDSIAPASVSYFCGPQPEPEPMPPASDTGYPDRMLERARNISLQFTRDSLTGLLPKSATGTPPHFNWDFLVDPNQGHGEARFNSQYYRSNCDPSERCTLAVSGSTQYRMRADDTGYKNLVVAGDWIANGLYLACMEGAIQGGIYAARAVAKEKFPVIGEDVMRSLVTVPEKTTAAPSTPAEQPKEEEPLQKVS